MKRIVTLIFYSLLLVSSLAAIAMTYPPDEAANQTLAAEDERSAGVILVANRAGGTVSVIDAATDQVINTLALPSDEQTPEPMYIVYVSQNKRIFVGDRANNQIIVFRADNYSLEAVIPGGRGIWHMWAHNEGNQLWVNNDIDNTVTVIDTKKLQAITTIPIPSDLVEQGGKPHDIILDAEAAYITLVGLSGDHDYVLKFHRRTFQEVARAPVGKDPHVILTEKSDNLYVASQNSNAVQVLKRNNLNQIASIEVPGAHGVWIPRSNQTLYVSNLPGGGADGLFTIDLDSNTVIGEPVDTAFPSPHNIVATRDSRKLYVTHSGADADKVTVYAISARDPIPVPLGQVTVGLNPFGLAFIPK